MSFQDMFLGHGCVKLCFPIGTCTQEFSKILKSLRTVVSITWRRRICICPFNVPDTYYGVFKPTRNKVAGWTAALESESVELDPHLDSRNPRINPISAISVPASSSLVATRDATVAITKTHCNWAVSSVFDPYRKEK